MCLRFHVVSWHEQQVVDVLEVTPDHLLFYGSASEREDHGILWHGEPVDAFCTPRLLRPNKLHQKAAHELAINDTIFVAAYDSDEVGEHAGGRSRSLVASRVTHIEWVVLQQGALTLYTTTGNVFVDGVLCSNFGDYYPLVPGLDHRRDLLPFALFALHRLAFRLLPFPQTSQALRWIMDTSVLPLLHYARRWSSIWDPKSVAGVNCTPTS